MSVRQATDAVVAKELSAVMPRIAELLANSVGADHCAIFAYSENYESTIALFRYGYDPELYSPTMNSGLLTPFDVPIEEHVIRTREPVVRRSDADFERFPLVNPAGREREGRHTDVVLPLIWGDAVQGSACLWRQHDTRPFERREIQVAIDVGRLAAMTIMFTREYGSEFVERQRVNALLNVASLASSSGGLDDVLPALAQAVRSSTDADVCSLYVYSRSGEEIIAAYQDGLDDSHQTAFDESLRVSPWEVPAELAARETRKSAVLRDYEHELSEGSQLAALARSQNVGEILLLPVVWQGELIGVMYCWSWKPGHQFTQVAIETAEAIALQAGGVISRARLEASIQQQTIESEALLRIGQTVLTSEALTDVLDEIAKVLGDLIPYEYSYIGMLSDDAEHIRVVREWGVSFTPIVGRLIPVNASLSGIAIRTGVLSSTDRGLQGSRTWKGAPVGRELNSMAVVPLKTNGRTLGTLLVARQGARPFSPREERLLTLLSQSAAAAIDRVQSRDALRRRAERQMLLAQVGEVLLATEDPETVLPRIAELAAGVIANGVAIGLSSWEFGELSWVADAFDDPEKAVILKTGLKRMNMDQIRSRLEDVIRSKVELVIGVEQIWPEHVELKALTDALDVQHLIILPLFHPERAPGLMALVRTRDSLQFDNEDVQIARIIANRIGEALERHQVKRNHEALLRISEAFRGQPDPKALIRTISRELQRIIPCDQLIIADYDAAKGMLHTQFYSHQGVEGTGIENFPDDQGISGEVVRSGRPLMENQADARPTSYYRSEDEHTYYSEHGESALAAPMIVEGEVVGLLFMDRKGHNRFTTVEFETFLVFAGLASAALDRTALEQSNRALYRASTEVLAAVVDAKDPTTLEHSRHVAFYSGLLAGLKHLPQEMVERIELAGLLHDVGKLGIPDRVLQKPSRLNDEEFALIRTHPDRGAGILARHPALKDLIPMVRHHHEAQDGSGYPSGLKGDEIPLGASIICVADAFDTMTSERTYQRRRSVEDALTELERCAGSQFDPELVQLFVDRIRNDPSLVYLNGDKPSTRS